MTLIDDTRPGPLPAYLALPDEGGGSLARLEAVKRALPTCSGLYVVFRGAEVLYVGQARNLRQRWAGHHRFAQLRDLGADSIAWTPREIEDLNESEAALIADLRPRLNRHALPKAPMSPERRARADRFMGAILNGFDSMLREMDGGA